jgi:tetratricopeptide (TPR) repeat protein
VTAMPSPAAVWVGNEFSLIDRAVGFMNLRLRQALYLCWPLLLFLGGTAYPQGQAATRGGNLSLLKDAAQSISAGNMDRAERELQSVLQASPEEFRALNLLGIIRAQQHREPEAERFFKRAIEIKPDFTSAHASLGLLYAQMSKPDEAIPELKEALRLDPGRTDASVALSGVWRDQAHTAVEQRDLEKALSLLIEARKINPNDANVQFDFGMVALRMSLFPDAVQAFQEALNLRKNESNALYGLGRAQMGLDKYDEAHEAFARFVQLQPEDASGHYALGMTLQALQRSDEARSEYEKSIQLKPEQTECYFQLGVMDLDSGDLKSAAERFSRVLKHAPHHAGALTGAGRVAFQQKEYTKAAELLQSAVAAESSLREAHYYLGLAYARLGRTEDSERELQIASQMEKEDVEKHRTVFRIIDPEKAHAPANDQSQ